MYTLGRHQQKSEVINFKQNITREYTLPNNLVLETDQRMTGTCRKGWGYGRSVSSLTPPSLLVIERQDTESLSGVAHGIRCNPMRCSWSVTLLRRVVRNESQMGWNRAKMVKVKVVEVKNSQV